MNRSKPVTLEYVFDVPVTLTVTVRTADRKEGERLARQFANSLDPAAEYIDGYNDGLDQGQYPTATILSACLQSKPEDEIEVFEEGEAE